jgi:hypothetical protein
MVSLAVVFVLSIMFIVTGNVFSFVVLVLLIAILAFVLVNFGFVKINTSNNQIDITYYPVPEAPRPSGVDGSSSVTGLPQPSSEVSSSENEVFYVGDNTFTYDKAENVCKAYDAELATYSQIEQAYNAGAEWCGYGWSVGGLALFPTQHASWERRQMEVSEEKRKVCGRPGINGGYFDPQMKFGVNCYGRKPAKKPSNSKGWSNPADRMIGILKDHLDDLQVLPFNKSAWSESDHGPRIVDSDTNTAAQAPFHRDMPNTTSQHAATAVRGAGRATVGAVADVGSGLSQFVKDLFQV